MKRNIFIGTSITDVKFPPNCTCTIEMLEKVEKLDHFITVGEKEIGGIKPTNFFPTLEKGEIFILQTKKNFIKITAK